VVRPSLASRLRDPTTWTSVSQRVKTALAAVVAWVLSVDVFHVTQPFLAPWAALLTVHATIFGTVRRGTAQAAATVLGVLFAFAAARLFGVNALSLGLAVLAGLAAGTVKGLRAEATTAGATAIIVMTTGYADRGAALGARLLDTAMGIAVALLVNLLVWPPLRDRSAVAQINLVGHRIGSLLRAIAADLRDGWDGERPEGWIAASDGLDGDIDRAWEILEQARESGRLNPRPVAAPRMRDAEDLRPILHGLAQAVAEIRSLARTVALAHRVPADWPPAFRDPWIALLDDSGAAVVDGDGESMQTLRARMEELAAELALDELPSGFWPVGGALIVNLRNILASLAAVAEARPVGVYSRRPVRREQPSATPGLRPPAQPHPHDRDDQPEQRPGPVAVQHVQPRDERRGQAS
jgi:uncharacterized membrane protein YccC